MDTIKFFFKNKEKKVLWRDSCFGVMFLCSYLFVSALFVSKMFHRGTNLSRFPMGNSTLTLRNDLSSISAEEPTRPFKATFRDVTVHPHPCPPPSLRLRSGQAMGMEYGSNKRSPPLVGGDRACPVPDTGGGGELSLRNKERQTQDVDDDLSKKKSLEIETIWFAYGEETQYLH